MPYQVPPGLTGLDRSREIAVEVLAARLGSTPRVPVLHRNESGDRATVRIDHGGDTEAVAVDIARLVAVAAGFGLDLIGENIGERYWALHVQSISRGQPAAASFAEFRDRARMLQLDAELV